LDVTFSPHKLGRAGVSLYVMFHSTYRTRPAFQIKADFIGPSLCPFVNDRLRIISNTDRSVETVVFDNIFCHDQISVTVIINIGHKRPDCCAAGQTEKAKNQ